MKQPQQLFALTIDGLLMGQAFTTVSALSNHYPIVKITPARASLRDSDRYLFTVKEQDKEKICVVSRLSLVRMAKGDISRMKTKRI